MAGPLSDERLAEIRERHVSSDVPDLLDEIDRLRERMVIVEKFVAARAEYITAINNCEPGNYSDYHRWQGHAEGRRQLAQDLDLPVAWPPEYTKDGAA